MQIEKVGVMRHGREITAVMILQDGPLSGESVVFVPTFYLLHLAKNAPINTLLNTASDLKFFFEALDIGEKQWDMITDNQMSGYIETTLLTQHKLSKKSIFRHCASIKGMYTYLSESGFSEKYFSYSFRYHDQDGFEEQGTSPPPKNFKLRKKYINDQLFEVLLEHASETAGFLRARNELILQLGHKLGLRASEVTDGKNLKLDDLRCLLSISRKKIRLSCSVSIFGKRKKVRDVDVPPELINMIDRFINTYGEQLKGNNLICDSDGLQIGKSFACRLFKRVKDAALPKLQSKLKELQEQEDAPYTISWKSIQSLTFHCLRHTYATNLVTYCYDENIDPFSYLPNQLGHSRSSTSKQYTDFHAAIYNTDTLRSRFSAEVTDFE